MSFCRDEILTKLFHDQYPLKAIFDPDLSNKDGVAIKKKIIFAALFNNPLLGIVFKYRGVVQLASMLAWGASGRPFESGHSDKSKGKESDFRLFFCVHELPRTIEVDYSNPI